MTVAIVAIVAIKTIGWLTGAGSVTANPVGTATIEGVVVDDLGQPIGGSRLWLTTADHSGGWSVVADPQGRFTFTTLPAATYAMQGYAVDHVRSYLTESGARWKPVDVVEGARVSGLRLVLRRASGMSGSVYGSDGRPLIAHSVRADRIGGGTGPASGTMLATTDMGGRFQMKELQDGEYILSVRRPKDPGFRLFHPDTFAVSGAKRVAVAPGEQKSGIDLHAPQTPAARIMGSLEPDDATPLPPIEVELFDLDADPALGDQFGRAITTDSNGYFMFPTVAAGRYVLFAQVTVQPAAPRHYSSALTVVSDGAEPKRVKLPLVRGVPVIGRVMRGTLPAAGVTVRLASVDREGTKRLGSYVVSAVTAGDGGFTLGDVPPGHYTLVATGDDMLVSVEAGAAARDGVLTVGTTEVTNVMVRTARRTSQISGMVRDAAGNIAAGGVVMAILAGPAAVHTPPPVRAHWALPSTSGQFLLERLPAGEFDIVAVTGLAPGSLADPRTLERLRTLATRISVADGEKKTIDLSLK